MKIDASIKAEFQLSHLSNLQLSASKNKDEWQFTGKTLDGQELSLQEIQESFLPHITEHLPIADLKAKDLLVDIRVKNGQRKQEALFFRPLRSSYGSMGIQLRIKRAI